MSFLTISAALLVLTVAVFNSAEAGACVGCFQEIKLNDKALKKTLNKALNLVNAGNYKNVEVIKAERQVVAGFKYKVIFTAKVPGKGKKVCHINYVELVNRPLKIDNFFCE